MQNVQHYIALREVLEVKCVLFVLLSTHVAPKKPSLHKQTKASTLTSIQVAPFSQGELLHASNGAMNKVL